MAKLEKDNFNLSQILALPSGKNMSNSQPVDNQSTFAPYLKHLGKTPAEQLEKNKPLMDWLKKQLEEGEELTESEKLARERQWEEFKELVDSFRASGHKLYSDE